MLDALRWAALARLDENARVVGFFPDEETDSRGESFSIGQNAAFVESVWQNRGESSMFEKKIGKKNFG